MEVDTVTISIKRFKDLETAENCLQRVLNDPKKYIKGIYYNGSTQYFVYSDVKQTLLDELQYLKKENNRLKIELNNPFKTFFKKLWTK